MEGEESTGRRAVGRPGPKQEAVYLSVAEALAMYAELAGVPETADPAVSPRGVNLSMLESALLRPRHAALYEGADIPRQAATLLWGMVHNHPFLDGNKRLANQITSVFLDINGFDLIAGEDDEFEFMMRLADGTLSIGQTEEFLRNHLSKR